jgi:hypothetical protein
MYPRVVEMFAKNLFRPIPPPMTPQGEDLLGLHIGCRVIEIKDDVALVDLLHEQILAPVGRSRGRDVCQEPVPSYSSAYDAPRRGI